MNLRIKDILLLFVKGVLMGAADIVPGISGGTIAMITGICEQLIHKISCINFLFYKTLIKR